jgi:hypothetical protein
MKLGGAQLGVILLLAAWPCVAQSQDNGSASATPSPATGGTSAVKSSAQGQTQSVQTNSGTAKKADTAAATQGAPANPSGDPKKPKKVWTNDDMSSMHSAVSVVGDAKRPTRQEYNDDADEGDDGRQAQVQSYRDQIEQIRGQIQAVDDRMTQLKNFKAENGAPSGGIKMNQEYNMVPVEEQVKELEEKKKKLEEQIEQIEDAARKSGIDPGELR